MAKRRRRDRPSVQARKALPPAEPSMETWLGWFHDEARACDRLKAGPAYGGFFCAPEWPPHSGPCNPVLHECAGAGS